MPAMNVNSPTYTLSATNSSSAITLAPPEIVNSSMRVFNSGTVSVFLVSGVTQPTAVFPTSATVPIAGTVIAPGEIEIFTKNIGDVFISGITASGTASVYISPAQGQD